MTLNEAQELVDQYIQQKGVRYFNELTNLAILMEEVGELARHFSRKFGEQSYKQGEDPQLMKKEMGDILFVLICLANQTNTNLEEALLSTIEKNSTRDSHRHQNNPKLQN